MRAFNLRAFAMLRAFRVRVFATVVAPPPDVPPTKPVKPPKPPKWRSPSNAGATMSHNEKTSPRVASIAARYLKGDPTVTLAEIRSVMASALTQAENRPQSEADAPDGDDSTAAPSDDDPEC